MCSFQGDKQNFKKKEEFLKRKAVFLRIFM